MNETIDPSEEQFFQQGDEAPFEPPEEPPLAGEPHLVGPGIGDAARARRVRLRRAVGTALLASVALFGLGLVRHYGVPRLRLGASHPDPERQATLSALLPAKLSAVSAPPATGLDATGSGAPAPPSSALPDVPTVDQVPSVDPSALIRSARTLLEGGHTRAGVAAARMAVNANPKNAEPYILLGAGLQDLGKWAEAQTVFATCKQETSSGPNATCRYFSGAVAGK